MLGLGGGLKEILGMEPPPYPPTIMEVEQRPLKDICFVWQRLDCYDCLREGIQCSAHLGLDLIFPTRFWLQYSTVTRKISSGSGVTCPWSHQRKLEVDPPHLVFEVVISVPRRFPCGTESLRGTHGCLDYRS